MPRISLGTAAVWICAGLGSSWSAPATADELERFPTVGFQIAVPTAWTKTRSDNAERVAWWTSPGSPPGKPKAFIAIDCLKLKRSASVDEVAEGLAENNKGKLVDRPTDLGGLRARRVDWSRSDPQLQPIESLVVVRSSFVYHLMGYAQPNQTVQDELEAIRKSWKWIPREPPYKHLELGKEPYFIFGCARIQIPSLMNSERTEDASRALDLAVNNFDRGKSDFIAYLQLMPIPKDQTFDKIKDRMPDLIRARGGITTPIEWRVRRGDPRRIITPVMVADAALEPDMKRTKLAVMWALVKIDDRRLISINFTLVPTDADERNAYADLADRIVDSIRPSDSAGRLPNAK